MGASKTFTIDECRELIQLACAEAISDRECELNNAAKVQEDIADAMDFLLDERATARRLLVRFIATADDAFEGEKVDTAAVKKLAEQARAYLFPEDAS